MLRNKKLVLIVAIVCAIIVAVYLSWPLVNSQINPPVTLSSQEQAREDAMQYIKTSHPETAQFMTNLAWTGGHADTGLIGAELYTYNCSQGWQVTIRYPVIPNATYTIEANYDVPEENPSVSYAVDWEGTWDNGTITETLYNFAQ